MKFQMGDIRETRVRSLLSHLSMLCIYFIFYKAVSGLFHHLQLLFTAGHASTTTPLACFGLSSFLLYIHRTTRKKITEESESISEAAAHFFSSATCRINTPFNGLLEFVSLYIFKERKKIFICSQQRFTVPHNAICFQGLIKKDLQNILSPLNISSHCTSSTSSLFLLSLVMV